MSEIARKILGHEGRMMAGSKSIYRYDNPNHVIMFNANLATAKDGKIWHGDLDVTIQYDQLMTLAQKLNQDLYVLYEGDARFATENSPLLEKALVIFKPDGTHLLRTNSDYYYAHAGSLYAYTDEEYAELHPPEPRELYKHDKKDFLPCRLPVLSRLKVTSKVSVLDAFQNYFKKQYGKQAKEIYAKLWITKEYHDELEERLMKYAKKKLKYAHPAKIEQSVQWAMFEAAPCAFLDPQSWTNKQTGYLKKEKKVKND